MTDRPICEGCGSEYDPDWCHCGESITHDAWNAGHTPVPMGCDCYRCDPSIIPEDAEIKVLKWPKL